MILLCEDGSLRIYMASVESTSYWLQPSLQPSSVISVMKPVRKRKAAATSKAPPPRPAWGGDPGWTAMDAREPRGWASLVAEVLHFQRRGASSASGRPRPHTPCGATKRWGLSC